MLRVYLLYVSYARQRRKDERRNVGQEFNNFVQLTNDAFSHNTVIQFFYQEGELFCMLVKRD